MNKITINTVVNINNNKRRNPEMCQITDATAENEHRASHEFAPLGALSHRACAKKHAPIRSTRLATLITKWDNKFLTNYRTHAAAALGAICHRAVIELSFSLIRSARMSIPWSSQCYGCTAGIMTRGWNGRKRVSPGATRSDDVAAAR